MYIIYNDQGTIIGTVSGPGKDYGENVLDKENRKWIFLEGAMNVNPLISYVDVATKQVRENSPIMLQVDKYQFIANGSDAATITGIPIGANMYVTCNGEPYAQYVVHDDTMEFATDQIAEYVINISCARYIDTSITLQSIAPPAVLPSDGFAMSIPDFSKEI